MTNNVAEYRGAILGLRYALSKGFKYVRMQGDSKLVCMQVLWSCLSHLQFLMFPLFVPQTTEEGELSNDLVMLA